MTTQLEADAILTWTKAGVFAQALGSVGIILTLFYSAWTFATSLRESYYAELDRVYFELLKMVLERPYLLSPPHDDELKGAEYEAYAFMVWNFLETVVDRCEGTSNKRLRDTWYPIIDTENRLHRAWFDAEANRHKFKAQFRRFIETRYPAGPGKAG